MLRGQKKLNSGRCFFKNLINYGYQVNYAILSFQDTYLLHNILKKFFNEELQLYF